MGTMMVSNLRGVLIELEGIEVQQKFKLIKKGFYVYKIHNFELFLNPWKLY